MLLALVWEGDKGVPDVFEGEEGDLKCCKTGKYLVYMQSTVVSPALGETVTVELLP